MDLKGKVGQNAPVDIHLFDGTYELFRAHYGAPPANDSNGREIGAVRGLMRSILSVLTDESVTHLAVAFDHEIESFRNQLFDGYKTGEGIEPALREQFELAERALRTLGIVVWPMVEFEADDALATAAYRYINHPQVERVFLCTPDKDLAQCVREDRIVMFDRMRRTILNESVILEKYGVAPSMIPDYLALVGDTADGIPGIPRWGAKSVATILTAYGNLEKIPHDETTWEVKVRGAKILAKNLRENWDKVLLYRQLATLRYDVPLEESLEDLKWHGAHRDELWSLCRELNDNSTMRRVTKWASPNRGPKAG